MTFSTSAGAAIASPKPKFVIFLLLFFIVVVSISLSVRPILAQSRLAQSRLAQSRIDPELIPPDVTLPFPTLQPTTTKAPPQPGDINGVSLPPSPQPSTVESGGSVPGSSAKGVTGISSGPTPVRIDANKPDPLAILETDKGTIVIRLFRKLAPATVASFIDIASSGFYNGLTFHRVEPGFCIQTGDPNGDGSGVYFEPVTHQVRILPLEASPSLKHNAAGVVAMAHFPKNPNTASCQFYITLAPQPNLDGQYSIFGGVINGMDTVNRIAKGDKIKCISIQEQPDQALSEPQPIPMQ